MTADYRTIAFPEDLFTVRESTFGLRALQVSGGDFLGFGVRVNGLTHQLWAGDLEFTSWARANWQAFEAFIAELSGQAVLFEMRIPAKVLPLGAGGGYATTNDPLVITGTSITGTSILEGATTALVSTAAPRNATSLLAEFPAAVQGQFALKKGDVFGLGGNTYMVTGEVTPDASNIGRIPFRAPLWKGAGVNDIIEFHKPTVRMQLKGPDEGMVAVNVAQHGRTGLSVQEVPYTQ